MDMARLMIPAASLGKDRLAVFTAYLDDSGSHGDSADLVVAGFAGLPMAWEGFEVLWPIMLRRHNVTYLHTRKLAQFSGEFKDWNAEKRRGFVDDFAKNLNVAGIIGVGATINSKIFREIFPKNTKIMKDSAFGLCFRVAVLKMCERLYHPNSQISFVLEDGHKNSGDAFRIFSKLKSIKNDLLSQSLGGFAVAPKKQFGALQAADFLAYNIYKNMSSVRTGAQVHESFGQLMQQCGAILSITELDRGVLEGWRDRGADLIASRPALKGVV
ncbi:DUF3800 domain-containing protein [Acidocella facilis]|uniref:DUF3800 domain-containing protein n=1 Tax=Acidocella facilis TaxID=525 RepID=UPI001F180861|nr:DUF3800 domain-containing protein [Acidocella facilis]